MKRFLFYFFLLGAIGGSTYVVLLVPKFLPFGLNAQTNGYDILNNFIRNIIDGTFKFGTTSSDLFIYSMAFFVTLNAACLLTMFLIFLFTGFNLNKIAKFYRISLWFLFSSLILSGFYAYYVFDVISKLNLTFKIDMISKFAYIPLASSLLVIIFGAVMRITEKAKK